MASHRCSISALRSVAGFFFSSANFGPLASLYVFQASGITSFRFFSASASDLGTSCCSGGILLRGAFKNAS